MFGVIRHNYKTIVDQRTEEARQAAERKKTNELSQYYGKQIAELNAKLADSNALVEKWRTGYSKFQEQFRTAFLKGMSNVNLSAMSFIPESVPSTSQEPASFTPVPESTEKAFNPFENEESEIKMEESIKENSEPRVNFSSIEMKVEEPKVQTKDQNWINATVMPNSFKQSMLEDEEQTPVRKQVFMPKNGTDDLFADMNKSKGITRLRRA